MTTTAVIIVIAVLLVLAAAGWLMYRRQRTKALRARFGPEYSHAVQEYGNEARAEDALAARTQRMEKIPIRSLSPEDLHRFADQWQAVQRDFVDDPAGSIQRADALVIEVMRARGYPMSDFEHRAEYISVDHPVVVQKYRLAHAIAERQEHGDAGTEDLRQAVIHYRDLFDELLEANRVEARTKR